MNHLQNHVKEIRDTLDYLLVMLDFMADFLYEPAQSFRATYNIKNGLKEVTSMIGELTQKDGEEKTEFIGKHGADKERLKVELNDFQQRMLMFNKIDPNNESARANQQLLYQKAEFDKLMDKAHLYQSRDEKLGLENTEYPISKEISFDFDLFLPIWNIAFLLDTDANKWL